MSDVTPEMIAVALGQAAPLENSPQWKQWQMWIKDAEMLIEARRVELDATAPAPEKIDYVVREAVVSHVRKPDDATHVTTQVDDGMTSKSYKSSKGRVTIVDEWWALLGLVDESQAFSVDTAPDSRRVHAATCSLRFGATYCSCGTDIAGRPIFEDVL
ncbi:hypothetical protein [Microbacterium sp. YY-01]|uniref:hypothetical protein n=1 Tax=Microbacterium sp. YY-01 TaxID=3421634 RepID=UPI003D1679A8